MSLHEGSPREDDHQPLSGAQEGLWYAGRLASDGAAHNTAEAVEIHGPSPPACSRRLCAGPWARPTPSPCVCSTRTTALAANGRRTRTTGRCGGST
ncbi:hypothetical protein NKH18_51290 [Streptomyces sp. M10(2022)]